MRSSRNSKPTSSPPPSAQGAASAHTKSSSHEALGAYPNRLGSSAEWLLKHTADLTLLTRAEVRELAGQRISADKEIVLIEKTLSEAKPRKDSALFKS